MDNTLTNTLTKPLPLAKVADYEGMGSLELGQGSLRACKNDQVAQG
jgi:hypothetical protein